MRHFTVPGLDYQLQYGKRVGHIQRGIVEAFYVRGKVPGGDRLKRYLAWREHVCLFAGLAGVQTPMVVTKDKPIYVYTEALFRSGVHADPENVNKAIRDALAYVPKGYSAILKRGSDKWMGGADALPQYDKENPRVEVYILTPGEWGQVFNRDKLLAMMED